MMAMSYYIRYSLNVMQIWILVKTNIPGFGNYEAACI